VTTDNRVGTFESWLEVRNYRPSTQRKTLADVSQLVRHAAAGTTPPGRLRPAAKRLLTWAEESGAQLDADVHATAEALTVARPRVRALGGHLGRVRKRKAESWSDAEWAQLVPRLASGADVDPRDATLYVLALTALRVGDVLRLGLPDVRRALTSGRLHVEAKGGAERILDVEGARPAWESLAMACRRPTVAEAIAPATDANPEADGAAYAAVSRRLRHHARACGLEGRAHLHRLRRTVAVQALRVSGGDVEAVRRLLGHASAQTTRMYLDEAMPERDAELTRAVRARFLGAS